MLNVSQLMNQLLQSIKIRNKILLLSSEFLLAGKGKKKMPTYTMEIDVMLLLDQHEGKLLPYQFCVNIMLLT